MTRLAAGLADTPGSVLPCSVLKRAPSGVSVAAVCASAPAVSWLSAAAAPQLSRELIQLLARFPRRSRHWHHSNTSPCRARSRRLLVCLSACLEAACWCSTYSSPASYCHNQCLEAPHAGIWTTAFYFSINLLIHWLLIRYHLYLLNWNLYWGKVREYRIKKKYWNKFKYPLTWECPEVDQVKAL